MLTVHFLVLGVIKLICDEKFKFCWFLIVYVIVLEVVFCQIHCWCNYVLMSMQILGCVSCSSGVLLALPLWDTRESNVFNPLLVFYEILHVNVYWLLQSCAASKFQNKCMNFNIHASATVFFIELLSGSSGGHC